MKKFYKIFYPGKNRISNIILMLFGFIFFQSSITFGQEMNLTKYVNPFIGTGGHGHTFPGVSVPFGMVQLSPDTRLEGWDGCSGYHFSDTVVYGFSHTHLSGTGCSDYGDILFMPINYEAFTKSGDTCFIKNISSVFDKKNESASAGYYSVLLNSGNIKAEFTATKRVGFHKYTFDKNSDEKIFIDLKHRDEVIESDIKIISDTEISGYRRSRNWARDQRVYFYAKFSKPIRNYFIFSDDKYIQKIDTASGKNIKAVLEFDSSDKNSEPLYIKVGISAVSADGAKRNTEAEIQGWDFESVRKQADNEWNKELNKIQVEGGTNDELTIFYTALYHAMLTPNLYMDVDGQYLGRDFNVHTAEGFSYHTVFSLWDTYRAEHPLLTIIDTKRTADFLNTFQKEYEYGSLLPVWELSSNETFCMIGYHSVPVIADAMVKGLTGFDGYKLFEAMKHSADTTLFGLTHYRNCGFVPQDKENESVSKTLEYAYDDWCISQAAKYLDVTNDMDFFRFNQRAQYYKNIFDPETGFMRARMNGGWYLPFDPSEVNNNYTEADAWQYTFYVPQDITGFAKLFGGKDKFSKQLDNLFTASSAMYGRDQSDITGLIGQYAHGNEPSHQIAYMYDYLNEPWKTQFYVNKIMREFYKNDPDGLIGNEDCGQMSAWAVLSDMGFYQVCPAQLQYAIGTPTFGKVTINLENGKKFIIRAENVSDKNYYIQSAKLNGVDYNKCYITHNDITSGGELVFTMGSEPNHNWGNRDEDVPITEIKSGLITTAPVIQSPGFSFREEKIIELKSIEGNQKIYYTLDGSEPTVNSFLYEKPFKINSKTTVKAVAFNSEGTMSKVVTANFYKIPEGRTVKIISKYDNQYTGGGDDALIDGIKGGRNWRLGFWQGYLGQDFEAIVDLGKIQFVKNVSGEFLTDVMSWICFPTEVEFSVSDNGIDFKKAGTVNTGMDIENRKVEIKNFGIELNQSTRYIKVKAKNFGRLPKWHPGAGDESYIFIDEIIIE